MAAETPWPAKANFMEVALPEGDFRPRDRALDADSRYGDAEFSCRLGGCRE
jgi:hypothetical protein